MLVSPRPPPPVCVWPSFRTNQSLPSGKGSAGLIEDLLRAGADPSARVANPPPRSTPLHSACRSTRLEAVKALLLGGADETLGDLTPLNQAPVPAPPPPGALAAALAALGAAGIPLGGGAGGGGGSGGGGGDGGGGSGGAGSSASRRSSAKEEPPRLATTPYGVVGIGNFGAGVDPTQRGPAESAEEYTRRRNPETMEAIRRALRYVGGGGTTSDEIVGGRGGGSGRLRQQSVAAAPK